MQMRMKMTMSWWSWKTSQWKQVMKKLSQVWSYEFSGLGMKYCHISTIFLSVYFLLSFSQSSSPVKETRKRFVSHLYLWDSLHVGGVKHLCCLLGWKQICCSHPGPKWWGGGCWFGWKQTSTKGTLLDRWFRVHHFQWWASITEHYIILNAKCFSTKVT